MGRRMSGVPSCAFIAPSSNCTIECMTDCGCMTTSMSSAPTPNSHLASITSNPLFIIVAESMVIFAPILQLGCLSACSRVTCSSCSLVNVRNGPPDAVRISFSTLFCISPARHWKMAECSESTGRIGVLCFIASELMSSPATTIVSLLARAMALPAFMALIVGRKPEKPTIAVTTMSIGPDSTIWQTASYPPYTFIGRSARASFSLGYLLSSAITTASGINLRAWAMSSSTLVFAVMA